MAMLGGMLKIGGRAVLEVGKLTLKASEKSGKAAHDSSKESLHLKSVSPKFDPLRKVHEHGGGKQLDFLKADIKESVSCKSQNGSLIVDKLSFYNSKKMDDFLENKVKFSKDISHKEEHFKNSLEEFNGNIVRIKNNSAKTEYTDNTKSSSDDTRLGRAFEKARENLEQQSSQYSSEEENFRARGTKIENYPYYDASRQKVVHEKNHKPLNIEKSTLDHNKELKDKIVKAWNRSHSMNNHLDNFNQQLRQIDPSADIVEALAKAYGIRSLLSEDDNTQQNTNGTSDLGDKLKEKMGLAGNKKNQTAEHKTGGESLKAKEKSIESVSHKTGGESLKAKEKSIESVSHKTGGESLKAKEKSIESVSHKTGGESLKAKEKSIESVSHKTGGESLKAKEKSIESVSHKTGGESLKAKEKSIESVSHKTGGESLKAKEKSIESVSHKTGGESLKAKEKSIESVSHMAEGHKTGEESLKEQQKTVRKLLEIQELLIDKHHKLDISQRNRNMEKDNITEEQSANSKLQNNDIKEENEVAKGELQDKKHKKAEKDEQPQEYGEIKVGGNNDTVAKYSKEWSQQSLEASLLSQRSVNREAKVASDLENSASKVLDAIPDVSTTVPTVTNVPTVPAANMLYKAGDDIQRPLKSSEGLSQRSVSTEQLKEEYIGLIESKAENEFQKSMARKSAGDAYEAFIKVGGDPKKLVEDFKEAAKSADFADQVTSWLRQKEYTGFRPTHQVQLETSMAREIKVES